MKSSSSESHLLYRLTVVVLFSLVWMGLAWRFIGSPIYQDFVVEGTNGTTTTQGINAFVLLGIGRAEFGLWIVVGLLLLWWRRRSTKNRTIPFYARFLLASIWASSFVLQLCVASADITLVSMGLGNYGSTVALDILVVLCEVMLYVMLQLKLEQQRHSDVDHDVSEVRPVPLLCYFYQGYILTPFFTGERDADPRARSQCIRHRKGRGIRRRRGGVGP